jgi:hypothetical protein
VNDKSLNLVSRRRRWPKLLAFSLLVVPCLIAANRAGVWVAEFVSANHADQLVPANTPSVIVIPESLDFGSVWETDAFAWTVVFQNKGDNPVAISAVRGGCDCTKVAWEKEATLQPGERVTAPITVDLLQVRPYDWSPVRSAELVIYVTTKRIGGEPSTEGWVLRGNIGRLLHCEPGQVSLGEDLIAGVPGSPLDFKIGLNGPSSKVRLKKAPDEWSVELRQAETQPPSYILYAKPCKLKPGTFADRIQLEVVTGDGRVMPTQALKVEGRVTDGLEVYPRPLDFGSGAVGTTVRDSLWIRSRKGQRIPAVEAVPADPSVKVIAVHSEGKGWRIDLERLIDAPGPGECSGAIRVKPDANVIPFFLRWYGTGA